MSTRMEYIFCLAAALALHTCTALPKIEVERTGFSHEQDSLPIRESYSQQHLLQHLPIGLQFRHHDSKNHDSQSVRNHDSQIGEHKLTPLPLISHNVPSYGTLSHGEKPSSAPDHMNLDTVHGKKTLSMHENYAPQLSSYQQLPPVRQITSVRPFSEVQKDDRPEFEQWTPARQGVVGDQFEVSDDVGYHGQYVADVSAGEIQGGGEVRKREIVNDKRRFGKDLSSKAQYMFAYDVNVPEMGNDFGHTERRDGPRTDGMYRVRLPDGRMQVVTYTVEDDQGFKAEVEYQ